MIISAVIGFGVGIMLARFYRVLVLIPATFVAFVGGSFVQAAASASVGDMLMAGLSVVLALHIGFLSGDMFNGLARGVLPFFVRPHRD